MDVSFALQRALRPRGYVCAQCSLRRSFSVAIHRRQSQLTFNKGQLKQLPAREKEWNDRKEEIESGKQKSILSILEERGYINAIAGGRDELDKLLTNKRIGAYVGIDPTAPSMHVGHLLPYMALMWLHIHGYYTISLLGAATCKVGDPTGRTSSRPVMTGKEQTNNAQNIQSQLKSIWGHVKGVARRHGYEKDEFWNRDIKFNSSWLSELTMMELLETLGSGLRMGALLSRDTVKTKLESRDGMSFSEFTYPLLQSWDWWHMYDNFDIQLQIGGSDQFGNIVTGMDSIKYIAKHHKADKYPAVKDDPMKMPYGFTVPLLTTASGEKFGKSAGNAVWLDADMTSVFDLYGFFVRTADADVERYLKLFTFLPLERIKAVMEEHEKDQSKRVPHHLLAMEFVSLVHGQHEAKRAQEAHRNVFSRRSLSAADIFKTEAQETPSQTSQLETDSASSETDSTTQSFTRPEPGMQEIALPKSIVLKESLSRLFLFAGLVGSNSQGVKLIANNGGYIGQFQDGKLNWVTIKSAYQTKAATYVYQGKVLLRAGKWNVKVVKVVEDEEFRRLGLEWPVQERLVPESKVRKVESGKERTEGTESKE